LLNCLRAQKLAPKSARLTLAQALMQAPSSILWRVAAKFLLAPPQQPSLAQNLAQKSVRRWQKLDERLAWTLKLWQVLAPCQQALPQIKRQALYLESSRAAP
jgi:hypothetical protein